MNCDDARTQLHDFAKDRLDPALHAEVRAHVEGCAACASQERAERALDELLEQRLPRYDAPTALKRRLALLTGRPVPAPRAARRWTRLAGPALAAGLAAVFGVAVGLQRGAGPEDELGSVTAEAVHDHLRVLASQRAVEIESGGTHQVKPWFEGKLDFAPPVPALDGTDVRLRGGSVGYVFDRKAAVLVYQLRLHVVTLLVFRADGLPWPSRGGRQIGPVQGHEASVRGFRAFLWRDGGLGYALVSDVDAKDFSDLAARVAAETVHPPAR